MLDRISCIIWDFNGTLLNDIFLSVQTINQLLLKRNLEQLSVERYKDVFSFPVKNYYEKIGFNFNAEPFEIPAMEYIHSFNNQVNNCSLHTHSLSVLKYFKSQGIRQFMLSAMEQNALNKCMEHQRISHYFEFISGLDDHYAASKLQNGLQLIKTFQLNTSELVLIGDTVHDYEVARELGCKCILIANGHQSRKVLEFTGIQIIDNISELIPKNISV